MEEEVFTSPRGGHRAPEPQDVQSEARVGPKTVPETPIRDVVDRCRVWEIHAEPAEKTYSQPVTLQCPITWVGAPVDRCRQTGMLCPNRALISVRIIVPLF